MTLPLVVDDLRVISGVGRALYRQRALGGFALSDAGRVLRDLRAALAAGYCPTMPNRGEPLRLSVDEWNALRRAASESERWLKLDTATDFLVFICSDYLYNRNIFQGSF